MKMDPELAEDLYQRSIALNQDAFQVGFFDSAYHALASALHSAEYIDSDQPLMEVQQRAIDQLAWIDQYHPEYKHSTQSANKRNTGKSIFDSLASQAETSLTIRKHNRKMAKPFLKTPWDETQS